MFAVGCVYRYSYLWARQRDEGEVSGRKDRPTCLLIRNPRIPDLLFLFPISSSPPVNPEDAMNIPPAECRRAGIRHPAWLYVSEFNVSSASDPLDFASVAPIGDLSKAFLEIASAEALRRLADRKAKMVRRS